MLLIVNNLYENSYIYEALVGDNLWLPLSPENPSERVLQHPAH